MFARSPRKTVKGLCLITQELDWTHGEGLDVYGTAGALLLAITGRPVGREELTGPGAVPLYERLT